MIYSETVFFSSVIDIHSDLWVPAKPHRIVIVFFKQDANVSSGVKTTQYVIKIIITIISRAISIAVIRE